MSPVLGWPAGPPHTQAKPAAGMPSACDEALLSRLEPVYLGATAPLGDRCVTSQSKRLVARLVLDEAPKPVSEQSHLEDL